MFPHERSLVEKYRGRPFVLVGVNTDPDIATLREAQGKSVAWRSFWDGGKGGPITQAWGVRAFPTVVLIDHEGVVRDFSEGAPDPKEFDREIEDLVRKAEK